MKTCWRQSPVLFVMLPKSLECFKNLKYSSAKSDRIENRFCKFNVITQTAPFGICYFFFPMVLLFARDKPLLQNEWSFRHINNNTAKLQLMLRRSLLFSIKWLKFHHEGRHRKKITFDGKCTSSAVFLCN